MTAFWLVVLAGQISVFSVPARPSSFPARALLCSFQGEPLAAAPTARPSSPPAPSAAPATSDVQLADMLLRRAATQYDSGQLAEALSLLRRAYALSGRAEILFDMAQVQRAQVDCGAALDSYRRFLAEAHDGHPDRDRARRRALEMQECVSRSKPAGTAPSASAPNVSATAATELSVAPSGSALDAAVPAARAHPRVGAAAWALLGAAVVSAGVCSYFAWRAAVDSDFSSLTFGQPGYQQRLRDGAREQRWARWSGAAAVLTGASGGGLMLVSRPGTGREAEPRLRAVAGWIWHF